MNNLWIQGVNNFSDEPTWRIMAYGHPTTPIWMGNLKQISVKEGERGEDGVICIIAPVRLQLSNMLGLKLWCNLKS